MYKKASAIGLLALLSLVSAPAVANAADYGSGGDNGGTVISNHCSTATMSFAGFLPGEATTASAPDAVTLAAIKAVSSASKPATSSGTVDYSVKATKAGSYTITVASATNIATATYTVTPGSTDGCEGGGGKTDSNATLPNTGLETPTLVIWGASGALILGVALGFVLNVVRRNKKAS